MGSKELNETLAVLNNQNDPPSITSANYLRTLEQLETINRYLKRALYGSEGVENDET